MESTLPYHERQSMFNQLCLVHALNMLLGDNIVDKKTLDEVCETLSPSKWWNPHRSSLGTGNYDINVAMYVLDELGYNASFFDNRKSAEEIPLKECFGLLLNVQGSRFLPGSSRHWMSYRQVVPPAGSWYLLDSKEAGPLEVIDMVQAMRDHLSSGDYILILKKKT
jgi:josephin